MPYYTGTTPLPVATLTLSFCMSCELSTSMPSNLKHSLESPSHPCPIVALKVQTSSNEGTPLSNPVDNKGIYHQSLKNSDLLSYLCGYKSNKLLPPKYAKYVASHLPELNASQFSGALYVPSHRMIICSYAHNSFLYVDHHALARLKEDNSPALPHMVLSRQNA